MVFVDCIGDKLTYSAALQLDSGNSGGKCAFLDILASLEALHLVYTLCCIDCRQSLAFSVREFDWHSLRNLQEFQPELAY